MIRSFRHKGLKRLYEEDDARGIFSEHLMKVKDILARLDLAQTEREMDVPGFHLHPAEGRACRHLGRYCSSELASHLPLPAT
jgi:proteic killer suppression protein